MLGADSATSEDAGYIRLRDFVTDKSGLEFPPSRSTQLKAAIDDSIRGLGLRDAAELLERFRDDRRRAELEAFIAKLTIGETYFLRNEPQFEALERHVLPDLIRRQRDAKKLRVWSAGCSSGEEPYSLAIVLDRILPDIERWDITILGTDIDREALKAASAGIYRPWSLRRTPAAVRAIYFRELDGSWELHPRIRRMVEFRYLNLVDDLYPSLPMNIHALDLIVCRNVLIYFGSDTSRMVVRKLANTLTDNGWLVVGHSEVMPNEFRDLALRQFPGAALFQKTKPQAREGDVPAPLARSGPSKRERTLAARDAARPPASAMPPPSKSPRRRAADLIPELTRKSSEDGKDPRPAYALAKMHADRGNLSEAQRWSQEALARDPLFAPAHLVAGLVAEEEGRLESAIGGFRRCIYADPTWPLPYVALARCFSKRGEAERCETTLRTAISLLERQEPDEPIADGDGMTTGRLLEMARVQYEISGPGRESDATDAS